MAFEGRRGAPGGGAVLCPGSRPCSPWQDLSVRQLLTILIFAVVPTLIIQAVKTIREAMK